jgi:hypothetical protein
MIEIFIVAIFLTLVWIAWELHRLVGDLREWLDGFIEGYQEAVAKAQVVATSETTGNAKVQAVRATSYWVETINTEYATDKDNNIDNSPSGDEILWHRLKDRGDEGWELVTFLPALPAQHFKGSPPNPYVVHAVFKRKADLGCLL